LDQDEACIGGKIRKYRPDFQKGEIQNCGIRMREAGAERIGTRAGKMRKAPMFGETEPASERESHRSHVVRSGES